ncbi:MAG: hypothetical protein V4584_04825, partial [Verrucomicrobiota bacterium]
IRQTAWITRHAEFLPDPDKNVQPNKRLELFFRHALRKPTASKRPPAYNRSQFQAKACQGGRRSSDGIGKEGEATKDG